MMNTLIILPYEIVGLILSFDSRFVIRNGRIINRININSGIYRKIIDMYSVFSFAYYSRNDELEEDMVIELPINEIKLYFIQISVYLDELADTKSVERFLSIKYLDERVDTEKLLLIF